MSQQIHDDPHGLDAWDQRHASKCFVTVLNSMQWMAVTGERPPSEPPTARDYTEEGLPWFDHYDADARAIAGAERFGKLKSVAQASAGSEPWQEEDLGREPRVHVLGPTRPVREANF